MVTVFPASIDTNLTLPTAADLQTAITGEVVNRLRDAIIAVEETLGVDPAGVYGTVSYRLTYIETLIESLIITGGAFKAGNDLFGTSTSQTVIGIYNHPVASTLPVQSAVPIWSASLNQYQIRQLTQNDILPSFSINSFIGSQTVEIGNSIIDPTFNFSYNQTPSSANIINSDNINSPYVLSPTATTATINGTWIHNGQDSVVFTLNAYLDSNMATSEVNLNFYSRLFAGVGASSGTSPTSSAGNTATLNNGAVLSSLGLFSNGVAGNSYTLNPVNQKIYFLLDANNYTFSSGGFELPFNIPSSQIFINQYGATIQYYLYESTNLLDASFEILAN
jgi:hypothetical protein